MVVKTIYIARHGYRSNWLPHGPYPLPPTGVDSDVPLAKHGVDQAKELAHYILSLGNQPEMLFSSPFYRCIQTSEPIADILELPIHLDAGLGEWYKPDREVIPTPAQLEVLKNFFPGKISDNWEPSVIPSNKGENEEDLYLRCQQFWLVFIGKLERDFPNVETVLLVTHAASKAALGMNLLGFSNWREPLDEDGNIIRSGSCSLDKYELVPPTTEDESLPFEARQWRMTMNGNTEFLSKGEEMNWDYRNAFEAGSDADMKLRREAAAAKASKSEEPAEQTMESVYVSVDLPSSNYRERSVIDRTASLQYSGLNTPNPLFKIGNKLYEGDWKKLVGTELAFPGEAALNKKSRPEDSDESSSANALPDSTQEKHETTEGDEEHAEKIYRMTDRIALSKIQPM
ncbi:YNL108C and TFC7 (YOR110W) [Zygosaccharomyces parabailii]|nr:YNL108C and TFC7 (YOR110W) [Zygosaccharomyces parabailii]